MKERPILFSAPMVRALLSGTKTQTRRSGKPVRHPDLGNMYDIGALAIEHEPQHVIDRACPYGQPGDRLWVRETWCCVHGIPNAKGKPHPDDFVRYRADIGPGEDVITNVKAWKPSIHMPRVYSRILLEIVAIRVERLQSIDEVDALYEGAVRDELAGLFGGYVAGYRAVWESINGPGAWDKNPWVWVIEFRRIS